MFSCFAETYNGNNFSWNPDCEMVAQIQETEREIWLFLTKLQTGNLNKTLGFLQRTRDKSYMFERFISLCKCRNKLKLQICPPIAAINHV